MKKILGLLLLLVSFASYGQFVNYTNINGRYKWIAGKFDSTFTLPSGTTPSLRTGGGTGPGALFYNTADSIVYQYTGSQWRPLHGSDTGRIQIAYVRNTTASQMTTGQVVYINGSTGNVPTVALAQNKQDSSSAMTFGFVRGAIAVNGFGWITTFGPIDGINTNAYTEGEVIYLDSVAGQFTHSKPQAPYHMVTLGYIVKKAGNGIIFTKIQNGYELEELHNVRITAPVLNKSVIIYDSVKGYWVDTTISAAGLGLGGSGTTNYLSKWTSSSALGNSLVQDDGTNVAIGTTPSTYKFRVSGNAFSSSYFVGTTSNTLDQFKSGGLLAFASSGTTSYTQIGYDATLNSGWITAVTEGSAYRPIIIGYSSNVGISTTAAPTSRLEIQSSNFPAITLRKTGVGTWNVGNRTEGSGTQMNISYGTTDILNVTTSGRVLIGTTVESTYELDLVGDFRSTLDANINGLTLGKGGGQILTNTAIGYEAILNSTTGAINNIAQGYQALRTNTTGNNNSALGYVALYTNSVGIRNTAVGSFALQGLNSDNNTGVGFQNLLDVTSGQGNTAIGSNTGRGITTGSYNTIIGASVTGLSSSLSNTIILADGQGNQRLVAFNDGNVYIGGSTSLPTNSGYKLDVNGTAIVRAATGNADFSFSSGGKFRISNNGFASNHFEYDAATATVSIYKLTTNYVTFRDNIVDHNGISGTTYYQFRNGAYILSHAQKLRIDFNDQTSTNRIGLQLNYGSGAHSTYKSFQINENSVERVNIDVNYNFNTSGGGLFGSLSGINASAVLEATSTTKGFLPPRMTGQNAENIGSPAAGLLVYINNGNGITITSIGWWGYDGTNWVKLN